MSAAAPAAGKVSFMNKFWSRRASSLEPYVPGEQPKDRKYIKLNTNENPYPPSPAAVEAMRAEAGKELGLYPDPEFEDLREALAEQLGVKKEQVYAGNGSDELLAFCFLAFFDPGKAILFPDITYSFYPVYSRLFGIEYTEIPLDDELGINIDGFRIPNGGIIFPNPNAPTGRLLPGAALRRLLEFNRDTAVIIDEAYTDFGGESAVSLIGEFPNLLIVRTLSKSHALAGLRVGYIAGDEGMVEAVIRVKNSFNSYTLDRISQAGARSAIRDVEYYEAVKARIIKTRERAAEDLRRLGFSMTESMANFLFVSHPRLPARRIFAGLKDRGILVRHFNRPRISNYLRISIGTEKDMDILTEALRNIIE